MHIAAHRPQRLSLIHIYWWDKTLELWYGQGLPRGLDEAAMADFVGIDRNTQFWLPHKICLLYTSRCV